MTIQQWRYVIAVVDHGGFSRAAEECFVTQPTLSSQIAKLEDELGLTLFDRLSRPVRPAPAAQEIIDRARTAIQTLASLPLIAAGQSSELSGTARVGIIPTLSQYLLPLFLREYVDAHRQLHLEISEAQSEAMLAALRRFDLDVAILALPAERKGLEHKTLFYEEFLVYLPPGASHPGRIDLRGLDRSEMLLLAEGHCLRDQIVDLCGLTEERRTSRVEFETGSLESLISLVDQGLGYTLLPELAAATLTRPQRRRCHRVAPAAPVREIGIVYHPAFARPSLVASLGEAITRSLPERVRANPGTSRVPWRPR